MFFLNLFQQYFYQTKTILDHVVKRSKKSNLKVSSLWRSWKKQWIIWKIAKGKKDHITMRKSEKILVDVAKKLDIQPPVFLIQEVMKVAKR